MAKAVSTESQVSLAAAIAGTLAMALSSTAVRAQATVAGEELEEIVVTGSRIKRTGFDTPTPVAVIDSAALEQIGANNLNDVLLRTPAMGTGLTLSTNTDAGDPENGAIFADLRGLGVDRSLTLINGRRRVSGSAFSSAVDLSTIPNDLIERVEITTGGAAAVYGADAVSGVMNITLRRDFDGVEVSTRVGDSSDGGAESASLSVVGGKNFDKGYVGLGLSYNDQAGLLAKERDFADQTLRFGPDPVGCVDPVLYRNRGFITDEAGTFLNYTDFTHVIVDPASPGSVRPFDYGNGSPFCGQSDEGDGFHNSDYDMLRVDLESTSFVGYGEYQLTEEIGLYAEIDYATSVAEDSGQPTFFGGWFPLFGPDNPFLPPSVAMDIAQGDNISFHRTHEDLGVTSNQNDRETYTAIVGLDGQVADDWTWDVSAQYGRFELENRFRDDVLWARFLQAADVTSGANGNPVCRDPSGGCVPLNLFGLNAASPEAIEWLQYTTRNVTTNTQAVFSANLSGDLFELPAGAVSWALGVQHRSETMEIDPDPVNTNSETFYASGQLPVDADFDVTEAFIEMLAPILRDAPGAKEINLEAAARYSDYNTIGGTTAWKLGGDWLPVSSLRVRSMFARSVRAPSLNELFSPGIVFGNVVVDPCDSINIDNNPNRRANCAALGLPDGYQDPLRNATKDVFVGGNPDLEEETSDSRTAGIVWQPDFAGGLRLAVDWWEIEIEDAIQTLGAQDIVDGCVDNKDTPDAVLCDEVARDVALGGISRVSVTDINVAEGKASGIDIQTDLVFQEVLGGALRFGLTMTILDEFEILVDANNPATFESFAGDYQHPDWRGSLVTSYTRHELSASWTVRAIDSSVVDGSPDLSRIPADQLTVDNVVYHDLFAAYDFNERYRVYIGVNNVADEAPPDHPFTYTGNNSFYDNVGRFFFGGLKAKF
jgi:outer membrane receptor protein involved in Fe transport